MGRLGCDGARLGARRTRRLGCRTRRAVTRRDGRRAQHRAGFPVTHELGWLDWTGILLRRWSWASKRAATSGAALVRLRSRPSRGSLMQHFRMAAGDSDRARESAVRRRSRTRAVGRGHCRSPCALRRSPDPPSVPPACSPAACPTSRAPRSCSSAPTCWPRSARSCGARGRTRLPANDCAGRSSWLGHARHPAGRPCAPGTRGERRPDASLLELGRRCADPQRAAQSTAGRVGQDQR